MNGHIVHMHRDRDFLFDAVCEYLREALDRGEAAVVIARPDFRHTLSARLGDREALSFLDAERTLERFMRDGMPDWIAFCRAVGGLIAELRRRHGRVAAYGEMVDILWQAGEHDAAIRLEEFWNDLGRIEDFSLFCAYGLDSLHDAEALDRICKVHTRLVPGRDHSPTDAALAQASEEVLEPPLSRILLSIARTHTHRTEMPSGHATLLWLRRNMPSTARRVLERARARLAEGVA